MDEKETISPELDKLVAEITPENINRVTDYEATARLVDSIVKARVPEQSYLKELDGEDYSAPEPDYVASDISHVVPKENTEIRLARLETAFAELLRRIEHFNRRSQHLI